MAKRLIGLRWKLFGSSLLIGILVVTLAASGYEILQQTAKGAKELYLVDTQGIEDLQNISLSLYRAYRRASDLALSYADTRKQIDMKSIGYDLGQSLPDAQKAFEQFQTDVDEPHRSDATKDLISQFGGYLDDWIKRGQDLYDKRNDRVTFEDAYYDPQLATLLDNMTAAIDSMTAEMQGSAQDSYNALVGETTLALNLLLWFAIVVVALLGAIVYFQNRALLRPVLRIHARLHNIASGNADLTQTLPVVSRDEVGEISRDFNRFLELLRELIKTIRQNVTQTETVAESLHSDSVEVSAALAQIDANNQAIHRAIELLDQRLGQASSSTSHLLSTLTSLGGKIREEQSLLTSSTDDIRRMIDGIQAVSEISQSRRQAAETLAEGARESASQLEEAAASVRQINESIDVILEMIEVVSSIASQTNLLSMNAAIEAAHAGEAGAGFSVVADEIRKLATTATEQSRDISEELRTIVDVIQKAWNLTHQTQESHSSLVDEVIGVQEALSEIGRRNEELQSSGRRILESLQSLGDASQAVASDMKGLDQATSTVSSAMEETRRVSSEVSSGMAEIAQGTSDITKSTQKGSEANRGLIEQVKLVQEELGRFTIDTPEEEAPGQEAPTES